MVRDNSGAAFRNKYKTADKHPAFKGKVTVGGVLYEIAIWEKESDEAGDYLSLSFSEPRKQEEGNARFPKKAEDLDTPPY